MSVKLHKKTSKHKETRHQLQHMKTDLMQVAQTLQSNGKHTSSTFLNVPGFESK
jgi:hypothetical protein